jgi:hypothetical protein
MAKYKHLFIEGYVSTEKYRSAPRVLPPPRLPDRDRVEHSEKLLRQFEEIWKNKEELTRERTAAHLSTRGGTYIQFSSAVDHDLITKSLEDIRKGIRLLNIKEDVDEVGHKQIKATVYIPRGKEGHFIQKIREYKEENTLNQQPKNAKLVRGIEEISEALLESLWTDNTLLIPTETSKWIEIWLNVDTRTNREQEQIREFFAVLQTIGISHKPNSIIFPERAVVLARANRPQLIELMLRSDILAEFRSSEEPAGFWVNESRLGQQEWIDDLLRRIQVLESPFKVCILDTGVNNGHPLLTPVIDEKNTLTIDKSWGTHDHAPRAGHGTLMAGIAAYGHLEHALFSPAPIQLTHKICSVKILPNIGENPVELWGDLTSQGISIAEIQNPGSLLVYCMAVTSHVDTNRGRPSSWSGAVDALAYGEGESQRLIIVSAGNVSYEEYWRDYPTSNKVSSVQNPGQAWNALVVGAYTEKTQVKSDIYSNYTPVAERGQLSPYSTTSLAWEQRKWPIKPDVVFEGGNLLRGPDNTIISHEDLELLSTSSRFNLGSHFNTVWATSAAAAQASWFAAKVAYEYPQAWAETVRGLIVHSANWTDAMLRQQQVQTRNRNSYMDLLRMFGYGVPHLEKALYSQESSLTYVSQQIIQPFGFKKESSDVETNEIHFYDLPWASELLLGMGEIPVKLKITLSYFIEPGPGEIGWKDRYRYSSHGLRFDINNEGETEEVFRSRINAAARVPSEVLDRNSGSSRWVIGINNRNTGSIHSDYWEGTAAALATCNYLAIYPVIGWWRERKHLGRVENKTRYSLIVSLETPAQDVELYTTVKNMISIPIEIKTN